MTNEEAEGYGLFTKWNEHPCQNCDQYTKIESISRFGSIFVCSKCLPKLQKAEADRLSVPTLFDGQLF